MLEMAKNAPTRPPLTTIFEMLIWGRPASPLTVPSCLKLGTLSLRAPDPAAELLNAVCSRNAKSNPVCRTGHGCAFCIAQQSESCGLVHNAMNLHPGDGVLQDQPAPLRSLSGKSRNLASMSFARKSVSALFSPNPFLEAGRVQTFQNSTRF